MTFLLLGSVLLIGVSATTLVLGWLNANEGFIWTSIVATAVAAVLLIVAFFRSRKEAPATATAAPTQETTIDPEILADREERSKQKYQRAMTRGEEEDAAAAAASEAPPPPPPPSDEPGSDEIGAEEDSGAPAPGTVVTSTTLGAGAAAASAGDPQTDPDATAATVGPPAGGAEELGRVVAVSKTKKFHSPGCRFASAKGAESMDRADAERHGYQPCGVCKP